MTQRPNRYKGWTQKFVIHGSQEALKGYLRVSENEDGTLHGIQIDIHREGSFSKAFANGFAHSLNIGIQSGIPLEKFVEAFRGWKFEPYGEVTCSDNIKRADSLMDYVVRELAVAYLGEPRDE